MQPSKSSRYHGAIAAALGARLTYYHYGKRDLFMLTDGVFAVILVATALMIRYLFADIGSLFTLAVLLVVQTSAASRWLRQVARR